LYTENSAESNLRKVDEAWEHLDIAKKMIEEMGYHRRDGEVEELEEALSS